MEGITDLTQLLASLRPALSEESFVFLSFPQHRKPEGLQALGSFEEEEGTTLICTHDEAKKHGLSADGVFRKITLRVHSSLVAVGLMAEISRVLAAEGIPCNVISAYYHDHLFVPATRALDALQVLDTLSRKHGQTLSHP